MMRPNPDHDPAQLAREAQTGRGKKKRGQVED